MTPMETVRKALAESYDGGKPGWDEKSARAALLALADIDLPSTLMIFTNGRPRSLSFEDRALFRTILLEIIA